MEPQLPHLADPDSMPCWCGQGTWRLCFRTARFGLLRCSACGCYRIDPPPLRQESASAAFYSEYYQRTIVEHAPVPIAPGRTSRFWRAASKVSALEQTGQSAVDIGCGDGHLCAELRAHGWPQVIGIDVSSARIARARQLYPQLLFYDRSLEETDIAPGTLDLIVMDNVIEHLPTPLTMVCKLRPYLRPGGRLVIITPNMESGHFRLLGRRWTPELAPHAHIFLFTNDALCRLLLQAGLTPEASGSFHLPLHSWRRWMAILRTRNLKEIVWTGLQESGSLYGRLVTAGPMLFAVSRASSVDNRSHRDTERRQTDR